MKTKEELIARAKELKINYEAEIEDKELDKLITEREQELEDERKGNDLDYLRSELETAKKRRDTATKERRLLEVQLKELKDKLDTAPDPDKIKTIEEELKALKDFKSEVDRAKEEEDLKSKTELERAEVNFKKQLDEVRDRMESQLNSVRTDSEKTTSELAKSKELISKLRVNRLESEIMNVAIKLEAINPAQIVRLTKDEFEYDANLDKFVNFVKDSKGSIKDEKSVEEKIMDFLGDPLNSNLVKSKANVGTGHRNADSTSGSVNIKDNEGKYDPNNPDLKKEADLKGLPIEELIRTKILRDKAYGRNKTKD